VAAMERARLPFADRRSAGRALAQRLLAAPPGPHPLVLALPRGGVPVAWEIARALQAPLELLLVRKIGCPGQPELACAALVEGASNRLRRPRANELSSTRVPSGDQINQFSSDGSDVNCVRSPDVRL